MTEKIYITADQINRTAVEKSDQETNISWVRGDDIVLVETSDNTLITRLKSLMERDPEHYKCYYYSCNVCKQLGLVYNYTFEVHRKLLSFRVTSTNKEYTDEEKEALVKRLSSGKTQL